MPRSLWRTLLALACMVAALAFAACGGDDEDEGSSGGTSAQSEEGGAANVTEQLFAGSAADNRESADEGKKGGKLTVLSAGDVDYMDPGKTYYTYAIGIINADPSRAVRLSARRHDAARPGPRGGHAGDLRGRQDRHGEAQGGRHVLASRSAVR